MKFGQPIQVGDPWEVRALDNPIDSAAKGTCQGLAELRDSRAQLKGS